MSLLSPSLQAFVTIAKVGTVHGAAERLSLTQTAVTQRLKGLEQQLNVALFTRSRRGMTLTSEGEALLRYCQAALSLEGETLAHLQQGGMDSTVQVSLTGPTSYMEARVIPQCQRLLTLFPNLLLEFLVKDDDDRLQALRTGRVQFAVIQEQDWVKELQSKKLKPESYVLVASSAWAGRRLKDIVANEKIIDFSQQDQMTFNYLQHYQLLEWANHKRHFINHTDMLTKLVVAGCGYTVLAKEFAEPYLKRSELILLNQGRPYQHQLRLAWYERPQLPAYLKALIDLIY